MTLEFSTLFFIYMLLFLAVILGAWIIFLWQRRSSAASARRFFICTNCGDVFEAELPKVWVRCPACCARHEIKKLKQKEN
jgi:hypothetical protein